MGVSKNVLETMLDKKFWKDKSVLITGHTGFKGSWLSLWLTELGATVYGFALEPDTNPSLFYQLNLANQLNNKIADIRNSTKIKERVTESNPDVIIHMAAQPLVRRSYREPVTTWETNLMGTLHLLEAIRNVKKRCAVVVVTTDKVYENREWNYSYREVDRLGGYDPYSSSKAATEIAVNSWRRSFFSDKPHIRIATARAGNVIGGGDWSDDRIIPDIARALQNNLPIEVRNPGSVRPWQHVLEPLSGYLTLAEALYKEDQPELLCSNFNFGPLQGNSETVEKLVETALETWPGEWRDASTSSAPHESGLLTLSIDKAYSMLRWKPLWDFKTSMHMTISWYKKQFQGENPLKMTLEQIKLYSQK